MNGGLTAHFRLRKQARPSTRAFCETAVRFRGCSPGHGRQTGFSLVEILISIVILSFGVLGMVGLQGVALQVNRDAHLQSTAVSLARELAEMMRGNKDVGLLASGNPYLGAFISPLTPPLASYCLSVDSATCGTPADIARAEITEWLARVDRELPGARVTTCLDTKPFDTEGKPQWICSAGAGAAVHIKIGWTRSSTDRSRGNITPVDLALRPAVVVPVTPGNAA